MFDGLIRFFLNLKVALDESMVNEIKDIERNASSEINFEVCDYSTTSDQNAIKL